MVPLEREASLLDVYVNVKCVRRFVRRFAVGAAGVHRSKKRGDTVKILVAADGSKYTKRAVSYLIEHLDLLGGKPEIHLVHVRPPLPGRAAAALGRSIVRRYHDEETRRALAASKKVLDRAGIGYKEVHMVGSAGELIAAYARKGRFSLLVLGSHGHGSLGSLLLGSVTSKVLAGCKVPALIIR